MLVVKREQFFSIDYRFDRAQPVFGGILLLL